MHPEQYILPPTPHVPNSPLPVLVYRNVLPPSLTVDSVQKFIERNGWKRQGPIFKAIPRRHFHPNVHECYGILQGTSKVHLGVGTADTDTIKTPGLHLTLRAGDVVVHPVGTAHSNISDSGGYSYLAFFPDGSPRWKSENGATAMMDVQAARGEMMLGVPIPGDPVTGGEGELGRVWGAEMERYIRTHTHTHTHAHAHTRGGYKL